MYMFNRSYFSLINVRLVPGGEQGIQAHLPGGEDTGRDEERAAELPL